MAQIYSPEEAAKIGYLDAVAPAAEPEVETIDEALASERS